MLFTRIISCRVWVNSYTESKSNDPNDCKAGGHSVFLGNFLAINGHHCLTRVYPESYPPNWWYIRGIAHLLNHELGHSLGLRHNVRYSNVPAGAPNNIVPIQQMSIFTSQSNCTTYPFTSTDINFNTDYLNGNWQGQQQVFPPINDCLTPWQLYNDLSQNCQPAGLDLAPNKLSCSNNMMDYNGKDNLSKDQIDRIQYHLNGIKHSTLACLKVNKPSHFCSFSYPRVAYYGSSVLIDDCNTGNTNIVKDQTIIVYNEEVVIENTEIVTGFSHTKFGNSFEIRYECNCE